MNVRREHEATNVTTLIERKTRYVALPRNEDRRTGAVLGRLGAAMAPLPDAAGRPITFDRGREFTGWRALAKRTGVGVGFCDPQAPHQKGAVENANARVRRWLPRETRLDALPDDAMTRLCTRLNTTPRKCLDYATPAETFGAEIKRIIG